MAEGNCWQFSGPTNFTAEVFCWASPRKGLLISAFCPPSLWSWLLLHKGDFCDALKLRHGWPLLNTPHICCCLLCWSCHDLEVYPLWDTWYHGFPSYWNMPQMLVLNPSYSHSLENFFHRSAIRDSYSCKRILFRTMLLTEDLSNYC